MRDKYENSLQQKFPWACGSCAHSGAPGFCGRNLTHGIDCSKNCHGYIRNNVAVREFNALEARGLCTGDAFTSINYLGYGSVLYPDYLWISICNKNGRYERVEFHDLEDDTSPAIIIDKQKRKIFVQIINSKRKGISISFDSILSISFTRGNITQKIYDSEIIFDIPKEIAKPAPKKLIQKSLIECKIEMLGGGGANRAG